MMRNGRFMDLDTSLLFFPKSEELNPDKKAPGGRLAGTARRGCGGWERKLLTMDKNLFNAIQNFIRTNEEIVSGKSDRRTRIVIIAVPHFRMS